MENTTIEGRNPVTEALLSDKSIDKIFISETANKNALGKLLRLAKEKNVPVSFVDANKIKLMAQTESSQGVVAIASHIKYASLEDILNGAKEKNEPPFIVICDEITDPHNLGAIIRTAAAVGADGIIIPKHRASGVNATALKTSAGTAMHIKIAKVTNIAKTIDMLKDEGVWIFGADGSAEADMFETDLTGACALVVGSEGKGISRLIKQKCDVLTKIPMTKKVESLNASVAAAVIMYEIKRQRRYK